jgi:hypothetical protein
MLFCKAFFNEIFRTSRYNASAQRRNASLQANLIPLSATKRLTKKSPEALAPGCQCAEFPAVGIPMLSKKSQNCLATALNLDQTGLVFDGGITANHGTQF